MLHIPVEEFSTPDPKMVASELSVKQAYDLMLEEGIRHIPVVDREGLVGLISHRDIFNLVSFADAAVIPVARVMSRDIFTVHEKDPLEKVVFAMSARKIGSAVVVDGKGKPTGIFTSTDALNALVEIIRGDMEQYDDQQVN